MEGSITKRSPNSSGQTVECGQWISHLWSNGSEDWLSTSNLRLHCFAFAVVSAQSAMLFHVNNETPGNSEFPAGTGDWIFKLRDVLRLFELWWDKNPIANSNPKMYTVLPQHAQCDEALTAARWLTGELKARTGLRAREIIFAPMPQHGWATFEIYSDGTHTRTPQVYLNAMPFAPPF